MKSVALITVIESNEQNINTERGFDSTSHKNGLYEDEAVLCFTNWRMNGGWLKDIPIYAYCPTRNIISQDTKDKLELLNVTYIEKFQPETNNYVCGFWNIPLVGKILEEELKEDILIHIDLDMNLIKPLPKEWFDNEATVVGQYDKLAAQNQRKIGTDWELPLDTGFIISRRDSGFYKFFYEELKILTENQGDERWKRECKDVSLNFLEEYVIDKAYNLKQIDIKPLQYYQVGEWYTSVNDLTDEQLKTVCFWHEHIKYDEEGYDKIREKIAYKKRIQNLK